MEYSSKIENHINMDLKLDLNAAMDQLTMANNVPCSKEEMEA